MEDGGSRGRQTRRGSRCSRNDRRSNSSPVTPHPWHQIANRRDRSRVQRYSYSYSYSVTWSTARARARARALPTHRRSASNRTVGRSNREKYPLHDEIDTPPLHLHHGAREERHRMRGHPSTSLADSRFAMWREGTRLSGVGHAAVF